MLNKAPAASELKPPLEHKETERAALTERRHTTRMKIRGSVVS